MISQDHTATTRSHHVTAHIVLPGATVLIALYPGVWNPDQHVRQVWSTVMVVSFVWLVIAAVLIFRGWVQDVTTAVINRRVKEIRDDAIAELDAVDQADWDSLIQQLSHRTDDWPGPR